MVEYIRPERARPDPNDSGVTSPAGRGCALVVLALLALVLVGTAWNAVSGGPEYRPPAAYRQFVDALNGGAGCDLLFDIRQAYEAEFRDAGLMPAVNAGLRRAECWSVDSLRPEVVRPQ